MRGIKHWLTPRRVLCVLCCPLIPPVLVITYLVGAAVENKWLTWQEYWDAFAD